MKRKLITLSTMIIVFFFLTTTGIGQTQHFVKGSSLKFTLGYGTMAIGDYNTFGKDFEQYFDDLKPLIESWNGFLVSRTGEFKKINMGLEFEGEIIWDLNETFGIGFGVGYIRRSSDSDMSLSIADLANMSYSIEPIISVIPINLSLYLFPPISPFMNIYLYGGFGYYIGKLTATSKMVTDGYWDKSESELKDKALGIHVGVGLEFNIAPKIAIFIEGKGRHCELSDWEGDSTLTDSDGWTESESGTMWYYEAQDLDIGKWYSEIVLQEDKPIGYDIRNIRKFVTNLSGISLRTGIRIKF